MKIGDVARALDLSVQTLRFYEKQGLLETGKTRGGTRQYTQDDMARIRAIRNLVALDIPLQRIRQLAQTRTHSTSGDQACRSVSAQLAELTDTLQALRNNIDQALVDIQQADQLVHRCRGCQTLPRRANCASCPVSEGLGQAQILQLIWDQQHDN